MRNFAMDFTEINIASKGDFLVLEGSDGFLEVVNELKPTKTNVRLLCRTKESKKVFMLDVPADTFCCILRYDGEG